MSGWYADLVPEEMTGRHHVRVVLKDGTLIEGRLVYFEGSNWVQVGEPMRVLGKGQDEDVEEGISRVLYYAGDCWYLFRDVVWVSLVWDEEEWESIPQDEAVEGDVLVINGRLYPITKVVSADFSFSVTWTVEGGYLVVWDMVSCALRRKEAGSDE